MAGITTIFAIRKKTIMRRVIAALANGFMCFIGVGMLFAPTVDPTRPVQLVLGGFLLVTCGLSVAASLLPQAPPDIITRRASETA